MKIRIDCPVLDGGGECLDVVTVVGGDELPPSRGGVRDCADITIAVRIGSPAYGTLREVSDGSEPFRVEGYAGKWLVAEERMPGFPSDGLARFTLASAG